jgi:hypothetical protein
MCVCLLLATCDRCAVCGVLLLSVCLVGRVIAEKLTGFQPTNKLLYCMESELSLLYIVLDLDRMF